MITQALEKVRHMNSDDWLRLAGLMRVPTLAARTFPVAGTFVAGAIVGGTIALLFAPMTGEELREKIRETARDIFAKAKSKVTSDEDAEARGDKKPSSVRKPGSASTTTHS